MNLYIKNLMETPFVAYYISDINGNPVPADRKQCFAHPFPQGQRWYHIFDEKDPKNPSNICVRLAPTAHGKSVGNGAYAKHKKQLRRKEADTENLSQHEVSPNTPSSARTHSRIENAELGKALKAAIAALPKDYSQLTYDYLVLGKSTYALSSKYGCTPKTISNRVEKIKQILQADEELKFFWENRD